MKKNQFLSSPVRLIWIFQQVVKLFCIQSLNWKKIKHIMSMHYAKHLIYKIFSSSLLQSPLGQLLKTQKRFYYKGIIWLDQVYPTMLVFFDKDSFSSVSVPWPLTNINYFCFRYFENVIHIFSDQILHIW